MIEKSLLKEGFLAGAMIGIAGFAYLAVGGFYGALLFSFGLVSIYLYKLKLFTGTAGNVSLNPEGFLFLPGSFRYLQGSLHWKYRKRL